MDELKEDAFVQAMDKVQWTDAFEADLQKILELSPK
jgi:hypothetical protein